MKSLSWIVESGRKPREKCEIHRRKSALNVGGYGVADVLIGVPLRNSELKRYVVRSRLRVISFAVTIAMSKYDAG